jgi:small GTP-binding protein
MNTKLKVCLIGATGVGKTSLAARYVHSIFSETYRTTIGVKIESMEVKRDAGVVQLVIWDISGEDEFQSVQSAYVTGTDGYLLVLDGTRRETVDMALALARRVRETAGNVPFVAVVNKEDLGAQWDVEPEDLRAIEDQAVGIVKTSARTGSGVPAAFEMLVDGILARRVPDRGAAWT